MYASVLLCFGVCQYMLWSEYATAGIKAKPKVKAWMWFMLLPDFHHLIFAYGLYLVGPYGRYDAACIAHYAIQISLTIGRLAYLVAESVPSTPMKTGTGAVSAALVGAWQAITASSISRRLPPELRLDGVCIGITGASRGLGLAIAKALASRGADLVLFIRSRHQETIAELKALPGASKSTITAIPIDLESLTSVDNAVEALKNRSARLNGLAIDRLVLNAGMLPNKSRQTKDNIDVMLQCNCLASVRLVDKLIEKGLFRGGAGRKRLSLFGVDAVGPSSSSAEAVKPRIVIVGSEAHRSAPPIKLADLHPEATPWQYNLAGVVQYYGHSKLYLHTWACALAKRLDGKVDVQHLCPGAVATEIGREAPAWAYPLLKVVMAIGFQKPAKAAEPVVWCAASPDAAGKNGLYLHLGREREPSPLASSVETGDGLWAAAHTLIDQRMK